MQKLALSLLFFCLPAVIQAIPVDLPAQSSFTDDDLIPNRYIVQLKSGLTTTQFDTVATHFQNLVAESNSQADVSVTSVLRRSWKFSKLFSGFSITASPTVIDALKKDPNVLRIEQDRKVGLFDDLRKTVTQSDIPSWGLARISQRDLPLGKQLDVVGDGEGVDVYVVDTGVNLEHTEFNGRASMPFAYYGPKDQNGHGTHVAGTIAGQTMGIAKKASIIGVKVLGASGSGAYSDIVDGLEFILKNVKKTGRKSVVNMSIGGRFVKSINDAVEDVTSAGIPVVVAAGNNGNNACTYSPSSAPSAITVAALNQTDQKPWWSNSGSCVDIWAPGVDITSAYMGSPTAVEVLSGTSMASPHVAGIVAAWLSVSNVTSPKELTRMLTKFGTKGRIKDLSGSNVNLIAFGRWEEESS
ncbi:peptidase S8/S53 domain-containing protein [Paraphysoderma sedebokerense]|nr:peptidase S8/S53 domain-containing protein [Paraphysoderma sedebokerense]